MAFGDYEHCWGCVHEQERDGWSEKLIGYKALYIGDRDGLPDGIEVICDRHRLERERARAIRAVVAAQWGVAICSIVTFPSATRVPGLDANIRHLLWGYADLPCAVDLVDGGGA